MAGDRAVPRSRAKKDGRVVIEAKWVGFDFGQTLCDTSPERTYWMIGDASRELGEPELVDVRCHRWRVMREKYGAWSAIKEGHRDEIVDFVFDGRAGAAEVFSKQEQKYTKVADGGREALHYLRDEGIELSVVAELKRTFGPIGTDQVTRFLTAQGIIGYFADLVSPQGRVILHDFSVDGRYKGLSKEDGSIYDLLAEDLRQRDIEPSEAVMVGDKEWTDITPAQQRGFKAVQYVGFVFHAPSKADAVIQHFSELKSIIRRGHP